MGRKTLRVDTRDGYDIIISEGLLDSSGELIRGVLPRAGKLYVVTDSNVAPLYGERLRRSLKAAGFGVRLRVIPAGESSKNVSTLSELWEDMMDFGMTRTDGVAALGGGVTGDLAGFAAATILRGVDYVQIPTTLLAQVDSSVGGKTAIDLRHGKNLAGAFYQPRLVIMDPLLLDTLPLPVFMSGMAEVVKYGLIWDRDFFDFLSSRTSRAALMADIEHILYTCCDIKRQVVAADEHDRALRMILNFGHTLGHAYELAGGYVRWSHGEAVSAGMVTAARLGAALGITPRHIPERVEALLSSLGLPTDISCGWEYIERAVGLDKKSDGDEITLMLLEEIGAVRQVRLKKGELFEKLSEIMGS